ncbi:RepB family plasmid replication initiator protein [Acinetobacter pittii]|jgi:plasmid replication initiation protein|uniref:replication initiation protein RepM n=1 Tax=Acinetobacter TaxID=469 RepID=UPI000707851D|nr:MULTISPECIES: replication initiation protein RepM [Acinetobacter]HAV5269823.1 RepB family plasmid replication initiator protein [Acinetobacter baumannii]KQF95553.1 DNA replication protein [Acinetobacter pittii]MCU4458564.1 replication initiation protein RepM [Acinetobacter pittii]MCU4462040.1 replication initiation protein RepM [Acinetobacter pittii]MCU4469190.1 replication initiation protein RepM [Acinetobacter pittii]
MKKDLVVKDNALINASYNLDLVEQRLILLAILEARESNTPTNKDLTIHVDSYINHFNVHRNTAYQALQDASRNLFERRFSYQKLTPKGNIENVTSRWVQRVSYVENEALVRIRFSDDVEPLITNLEKHFTSYELEQVSNLTSVYAIRLYELLIAWRSTGKVAMIGLDELRSKLGIEPHEYKRMGQFKEKVLHLAIEQINDHTDIKADYEQHKKGRSIVGFSFSFKQKTKPKPVKQQRDPDTLDMFCDMSDAQIKTYSSILSKVHSISDLAGNKDYSAFAVWIGNVLRDPASVREETAKRVFKALRTETDFKG